MTSDFMFLQRLISHIFVFLTKMCFSEKFSVVLQANNNTMDIKFITQGLPTENQPAGNVIIESLQSGQYHTFWAFSAFVSSGGVNNIKDSLLGFIETGGTVCFYVGVDLQATSKEALELLMELSVPTYIVHSPNSIVYHPKVYVFQGTTYHKIIVGSSNLTSSGLFQNVEASICVSFNCDDEDGIAFENSILNNFHDIVSPFAKSTQLLDQSVLKLLVANNKVLSENTVRQARNNISKSLPKVSCTDRDELAVKFKKLKVKRPPKGFKNSVREENITTSRNHDGTPTIIYNTSVIKSGSMWIESGKMTGGSRNILDLSKKGMRDGVTKFGSVEFFDIDKNDYDTDKDIVLVYNNKKYLGNTIKYTSGNSNWRIQLKGVTDDNEKLTDVFHANGSQGKIFVFECTNYPDVYNFHILDSDELDRLIDISSDWTYGGSGRGRKYGLIS